MKSKNKRLRRWYFITPIVILLICALAFLFRGWIRETVVPDTLSLQYGRQVKNILNQQYKELGQPLSALGLGPVSSHSGCVSGYARHFQIDVDCSASLSGYSNRVAGLIPNLGVRADKLAAMLKTNGWQGGNIGLSTLGNSIANGVDWQPDAAYTKVIGKVTCIADFNTAFSKPKPPAMSGGISCSRTIDLFGPNCGPSPTFGASSDQTLKW